MHRRDTDAPDHDAARWHDDAAVYAGAMGHTAVADAHQVLAQRLRGVPRIPDRQPRLSLTRLDQAIDDANAAIARADAALAASRSR